MPTLNWIGKEKVVNHHLEVPYRVLEHRYGYHAENTDDKSFTGSGNMIIHGDNLEALKALLPEYEGKVKCIYIDPPYNTGNEGWVYNDNVNHPKIQKWLGDVVGKQDEDFTRHDKWLCMMYPRLRLLQRLLSEDGAIFISIDDNEQANLKLLCDEIFGARNFVANIIWQKKTGAADSNGIATITEHILCYCNNIQIVNKVFTKNYEAFDTKRYRYKDEYYETRGAFYYDTLDRGSIRYSDTLNYGIEAPNGDIIFPNGRTEFENDGWTWKWSEEKVKWGLQNGFISIVKSPKSKNGWVVKYKIYLNVDNEGNRIDKSVPYKNLITDVLNADAASLMKKLFEKKVFEYSKPVQLIETLLRYVNTDNSIILDSFAGSGTTAHAVLNLNKKDGGKRNFILVEMEDYADTITAERVRKVMSGYADTEGTGGCFDFYELGEPLFNADGTLNESVDEDRIREYVYYTETKQHLSRKREKSNPYLLDTWNGVGYYLYYEPNQETAFTYDKLSIIGEKAERYIVYADACTIDKDYLTDKNIIFRKIQRDIQKF